MAEICQNQSLSKYDINTNKDDFLLSLSQNAENRIPPISNYSFADYDLS